MTTLLQLRTQFVELSGRFDLVVNRSAYADSGANFFIQSGQRYLQSLILTQNSEARILRLLPTDGNRLSFSDCQSIKNVWLRKREPIISGTMTTGQRYQIMAISLLDFTDDGAATNTVGTRFTATSETLTMTAADNVIRLSFDDTEEVFELSKQKRNTIINQTAQYGTITNADQPQYWSPDIIRDADVEGNETLRGVLMGASADQNYAVALEGVFKPKFLDTDTYINFWTEEYPDVLLFAAYRAMEIFYRNSQGVSDWDRAITESLMGIDSDIVQEDGYFNNQMRG